GVQKSVRAAPPITSRTVTRPAPAVIAATADLLPEWTMRSVSPTQAGDERPVNPVGSSRTLPVSTSSTKNDLTAPPEPVSEQMILRPSADQRGCRSWRPGTRVTSRGAPPGRGRAGGRQRGPARRPPPRGGGRAAQPPPPQSQMRPQLPRQARGT